MSAKAYHPVSMLLHWLMALLIIGMLALGWYMTGLPATPAKFQLYDLHKAIGISLLLLTFLRLFWRLAHPPASLPRTMPVWQCWLANTVHILLYVLMVASPLSGWLLSSYGGHPISFFGLFTVPALAAAPNPELGKTFDFIHVNLLWVWLSLLALHISGALYHTFIKKDGVLLRMLPIRRPRSTNEIISQ